MRISYLFTIIYIIYHSFPQTLIRQQSKRKRLCLAENEKEFQHKQS
jgi:hypothetical protein